MRHNNKVIKYQTCLSVFLLCITVSLQANGVGQASDNPAIIAHRGGSGLWIQNSRYAVEQLLLVAKESSHIHGIEVDIVLTKDKVPVLAHDPWVHKTLCERTNEKPLANKSSLEEKLIQYLSFSELQNNFRCGHISDEEFPQAKGVEEPVMSFEELVILMNQAPHLTIYLDLKIQESLTLPAADYAQAILSIWSQLEPDNALMIEVPNRAAVEAFAPFRKNNISIFMSYPPFYAGENWTWAGVKTLLHSWLIPKSAKKAATEAGADGITTANIILNTRMQRQLERDGLQTAIFTINTQEALQEHCGSDIDIVITDYPGQIYCEQLKAP